MREMYVVVVVVVVVVVFIGIIETLPTAEITGSAVLLASLPGGAIAFILMQTPSTLCMLADTLYCCMHIVKILVHIKLRAHSKSKDIQECRPSSEVMGFGLH